MKPLKGLAKGEALVDDDVSRCGFQMDPPNGKNCDGNALLYWVVSMTSGGHG